MFPKALILYLGTSGAKPRDYTLLLYLPANSSLPECDCSFLFMFHQTAEMVLREKINKKDYFLLRLWSIESVPDLSLPPCTLGTGSHVVNKLFKWLFSGVLASHPGGPGSIPGQDISVLGPLAMEMTWRDLNTQILQVLDIQGASLVSAI